MIVYLLLLHVPSAAQNSLNTLIYLAEKKKKAYPVVRGVIAARTETLLVSGTTKRMLYIMDLSAQQLLQHVLIIPGQIYPIYPGPSVPQCAAAASQHGLLSTRINISAGNTAHPFVNRLTETGMHHSSCFKTLMQDLGSLCGRVDW